MRKLFSLIMIMIISVMIGGCEIQPTRKTITIADQFGLAYAPVQIMKEKRFIEKLFADDDINIRWKKLANTAAIREAMLAGEVDIGFMAIPPFLIGRDKGMKWKIISGLSQSPLGLMTYKENIKTLADIDYRDRIALPQPGSIQHILLSMAARREFGDAGRFDNQLVTMAHPDGMNALLTRKEITLHFTSPPYIFKESGEEGIHRILSGREALGGDFSFIVGAGTEEFYNNHKDEYRAFVQALQQSIEFINKNPEEAAGLLGEHYDLSQTETEKYITWPGMNYTDSIRGLDKFVDFMQEAGYIDFNQKERELSQLLWDVDLYEKQ